MPMQLGDDLKIDLMATLKTDSVFRIRFTGTSLIGKIVPYQLWEEAIKLPELRKPYAYLLFDKPNPNGWRLQIAGGSPYWMLPTIQSTSPDSWSGALLMDGADDELSDDPRAIVGFLKNLVAHLSKYPNLLINAGEYPSDAKQVFSEADKDFLESAVQEVEAMLVFIGGVHQYFEREHPHKVKRVSNRSTIEDLTSAKLLSPGTPLLLVVRKGTEHEGNISSDGKGIVTEKGSESTPSGAARLLGYNANGWDVWYLKDSYYSDNPLTLKDLRQTLLEST